ncbi:hypothetical protein RUND412_007187 [Rhizina undulata]
MVPPLESYTALEALLIFSNLHTYGIHPSTFPLISNVLSKNAILLAYDGFEKARLAPEAIRAFYEHHVGLVREEFGRFETKTGADIRDRSNGGVSHQGNLQQSIKLSPLATTATGLGMPPCVTTMELVKILKERFYHNYIQYMVGLIRRDEETIFRIKKEIEEERRVSTGGIIAVGCEESWGRADIVEEEGPVIPNERTKVKVEVAHNGIEAGKKDSEEEDRVIEESLRAHGAKRRKRCRSLLC